MTQANAVNPAIRALLDGFKNRGWTDRHNLSLNIVRAVLSDPTVLDDKPRLGRLIPASFLVAHRVRRDAVIEVVRAERTALDAAVVSVAPAQSAAIIQIDDIDTFDKVGSVAAPDIAKYATPIFDVPEDYIKRMVAEIVGEPYVQKDWGGEFDDMFSGQAQLFGRRVTTTFLFKGPGLGRKSMRPKDLGTNGDQIDRMMLQPAELFVVQFVGKIEASVRRQLERAIVSRRAAGYPAVGTVWDGADTARLAAAYGYLDRSTGVVRVLGSS